MPARNTAMRATAAARATKAADTQTIRRQAAEIVSLTATEANLFAAMLAELDSRIDDITARTDRLLAQHG
jgi:hypothetical protein